MHRDDGRRQVKGGTSGMIFDVWSDGRLALHDRQARAVFGRGGVIPAAEKREGDGATPAGTWPIRRVLFRPDREPAPDTALPASPIGPDDGWCDAPDDPAYNRPVALPYPASAERLWRDDGVYDLLVVLGHNDDPPAPSLGSAIFLHLQRPDLSPTDGCVALDRPGLLTFLAQARPGDAVRINLTAEP
jgi:L,D-peptidoglycan transpeptidase YkuD (ErfK/YbiS/YcfS/YnhG family)